MRKSTVTSLKTRLREYENDTSQVHHEAELRFIHPKSDETEHQFDLRRKEWVDGRSLRLRCNFLEETLKLYQSELQHHIGDEKRDRKDFERDVIKEMEVLDETNRAVLRQLHQSQVEVESMQEVQDELQKRAATHYERLIARHRERSENQKRVLENENTALRVRIAQLETSLANWKQMEETETSTQAHDANYRMSMLKEEVKEKNLEFKRSVQQQHKLENSLSHCREQLQLVLDFIDGCGSSAQRVELVMKQIGNEHHRLVNRLLSVANSESDLPMAMTSSNANNNDMNDSQNNTNQPKSALEELQQEYEANNNNIGGNPNESSYALTASSTGNYGGNSADRATSDAVRLQKAVDRICEVVHEQHVELALAIDSAATVWEAERKQLELKQREALSHGQTLQTRIQVVERQAAAAQEDAMSERDRALQLRDQAIVFLRAKDMKEQRLPMRNQETMTTESYRSGDLANVG